MIRNVPLSVMYPKLCEEWSDKNLPLTPDQFSYSSHDVVWWKGSCGHEWQASINNRANGTKCPYCMGRKVLKGFNDLETLRPDIAAEWSERNLPLTPDQVMPYSRKKVWWRCKHGHEWQTTVHTRSCGNGCPICSNKTVIKGLNDYASRYPKLLSEWSDKNLVKLEDVRARDGAKRYWWKCPVCGNEYQKTLVRKLEAMGCPFCAKRKAKEGFSDLKTTDPEIAFEWNEELNGGWMPEDVTRRSRKFIRWNCECGHVWDCKISERILSGKSCVICAAEFRAVLPLWLAADIAFKNRMRAEINIVKHGIALQLYLPELDAAFECGGVSEEKKTALFQKKEAAAKLGISLFVLPILPKRKEQIDAVAMAFGELGIQTDIDPNKDVAYLESRFRVIRKEIHLGVEREETDDMNEEMKMLLRLILAQEEETEAGQNVQPAKKKRDQKDPDPRQEDMQKARRELEQIRKNVAADLSGARQDMYATHENNISSMKEVPIWEKYALTVTEASQYFHLGVKKLREIINRDKYASYLIWNGGRVYIKRKLFEEFLDKEINL